MLLPRPSAQSTSLDTEATMAGARENDVGDTSETAVRAYLSAGPSAESKLSAASALEEALVVLEGVLTEGGRVFIAGNGGSASTASHMAVDLSRAAVASRRFERVAISDLVSATSVITALGNDRGFEHVFADQLEAAMTARDMLIVLSVSGESPNLVRAVEVTRALGGFSIGFVGTRSSTVATRCDHVVAVESSSYGVVEDAHMAYNHALVAGIAGLEYLELAGGD